MNRKERRVAEHIARKAARKAGFPEPQPIEEPVAAVAPTPEPEPESKPKKEISEAQLAANRANALRSTGPSPANFDKISNNALKHGLTGRAVVLPGEDADLYESRMLAYQEEFQPVGPEETELLQSIVDVRWRLGRIPGLELATLVVGRKILTDENPALVAECNSVTLEWHIRQRFEKTFRNLSLQERALAKRREKEMAELRELQAARRAAAAAEPEAAEPQAKPQPTKTAKPPSPKNGFVFENPKIAEILATAPAEISQLFEEESLTSGNSPLETMPDIAA